MNQIGLGSLPSGLSIFFYPKSILILSWFHPDFGDGRLYLNWIGQVDLHSFDYRTRAIITCGLYTFYPIFEGQKRFFKELFL